MELQYIVAIATFLISLILGEIAKKLNQDITIIYLWKVNVNEEKEKIWF